MSNAPVWFQSAVNTPNARVKAAPSEPASAPAMPDPLVKEAT